MARYKITGPDGASYEITAPDGASESDVMEFFQSQMKGQGAAPQAAAAPQKPPVSAGEMVSDVAKSTGIGLAQGAIGLATLPGNIEALGRMGIDAGARAIGLNDPKLSERTFLPTYGDAKGKLEQYTGEFYEPKTTAGEYARTAGEFASLAVGGPASLAGKAARVAGPALASETAGQLTEGTSAEPWARMGGALIGGRLPGASMRAVTPNPVPTEIARQVAALEKEGVTALTAGQKIGSKPVKWAESVSVDTPFTGGKAARMLETQGEQFTKAALKRAGINANRATPDVMDQAFASIGKEYSQLGQSHNLIYNNRFTTRLADIGQRYEDLTAPSMRVPLIRGIVDDLQKARPAISGQEYARLRSDLERARRGLKGNPGASQTLGELKDLLDNQFAISAPKGQAGAVRSTIRDLNKRYRNMIVIEDAVSAAGENAAMGLISPSALRTAVKKQNKRAYVRGTSDLAPLARAGEAIMKPLPQSGTGPRSFWQNAANGIGVAGGAFAGGPAGAMAGLMVPALTQGTMGRLVMSGPMQRYLSNQRLAPNIASHDPQSALRALPLVLMEGERGLRGGSGPRYDENGNLRQR